MESWWVTASESSLSRELVKTVVPKIFLLLLSSQNRGFAYGKCSEGNERQLSEMKDKANGNSTQKKASSHLSNLGIKTPL